MREEALYRKKRNFLGRVNVRTIPKRKLGEPSVAKKTKRTRSIKVRQVLSVLKTATSDSMLLFSHTVVCVYRSVKN